MSTLIETIKSALAAEIECTVYETQVLPTIEAVERRFMTDTTQAAGLTNVKKLTDVLEAYATAVHARAQGNGSSSECHRLYNEVIRAALAAQAVPAIDVEKHVCGYARLGSDGVYKLVGMRRNPIMDDGELHLILAFTDDQIEAFASPAPAEAKEEQALRDAGFITGEEHDQFLQAVQEAKQNPPQALHALAVNLRYHAINPDIPRRAAQVMQQAAAAFSAMLAAPQPQAAQPVFKPPIQPEGSREAAMVTIARDQTGRPTVWCDPEIAHFVASLNAAGIPTVWSCSGHGHRPGVIGLKDGTHLMILNEPDFRKANAIFRTDINGHAASGTDFEDTAALRSTQGGE